jgi:hypothetical protein
MSMDTWCIVLMEGRLLGTRKRSVHLSGQGRLLDRHLRQQVPAKGLSIYQDRADYWTDIFANKRTGRYLHNEIRVQCPDRSMPRPTLRTQKVCPIIAPRLRQLDRPLRGYDVTDPAIGRLERATRGTKCKDTSRQRTQKVCPIIAPRLRQLDRPLRGYDVTDPAIGRLERATRGTNCKDTSRQCMADHAWLLDR